MHVQVSPTEIMKRVIVVMLTSDAISHDLS